VLSQYKQADRMQASQAAGQAVAQRIGDYASAQEKATGDPAWKEGGANRIALHVAGGALVAGLGGGSIGSAAQGAAGAGVAAWAAGDLNRLANGTRDALGGGDAAQLAGNVAANILAGGMGALVGGGAGAFAASNADLYNRSTGNGDGHGSTANSALGWIGDQLASAGRGAENLASQFAALVNANGPQGPYVNPDDLSGPGGNSKPPAAGGSAVPVAVCVPPVCTVVPATTPGYAPSNAIFNSGSDGQSSASNGNTSDLQSAANQPINDSGLSAAARAWDKHAGRPGGTFEPLTGSIADKNAAASEFVNQVLNDPSTTQTNLSRGGVEFRLPNGQGIRFNADGSFSGFLDPRK
jgi:filamentous hemagglutinin